MKNAEEELASIGFGRNRGEPVCWRAVRLDGPTFSARAPRAGPEPACSRALAHWRELLARSPDPSPYRISRADG
jgi:hypothetical protein